MRKSFVAKTIKLKHAKCFATLISCVNKLLDVRMYAHAQLGWTGTNNNISDKHSTALLLNAACVRNNEIYPELNLFKHTKFITKTMP